MYEFRYDYVKPKIREKEKLFCMDADNFIVHIKTRDIYINIAKNVEIRSDFKLRISKPLPREKNEKVGSMKDKIGGKIMKVFKVLRLKTYSYLTDDKINNPKVQTSVSTNKNVYI